MSFNGFVFNFINDLKISFNFGGGGRKGRRPSIERTARSFVALGLFVCMILVVAGLTLVGATAGIESGPDTVLNKVQNGIIGAGLIPGMFLFVVYLFMDGGKR